MGSDRGFSFFERLEITLGIDIHYGWITVLPLNTFANSPLASVRKCRLYPERRSLFNLELRFVSFQL